MSYTNVALAVIPSGIKSNIVYSLIGGDMTFVRTSAATRRNKDGLIEYVPIGQPRLDYDGAIPHLLLEPQRSNGLQYSEDFSNAYWTKTNVTVETDANIAPDGNTTADIMRETTANSEHRIARSSSFGGGGDSYTFSVFAKSGGRKLNLFSATSSRFEVNATFDLDAGTVSTVTGTASIESYPNGWYKCSVSGVSSSSGSSTIYYRHRDDSNNTSYTGDTAKFTLLWGAQLEEGAYVTSYIPRLDSVAATRNAETCNSGTGDFNSNEGVLFAEIQAQNDDPGANIYLGLSDGTASNMLIIRYTTDGLIQIHNNGTSLSNRVFGDDLDLTQTIKVAVKYGTQTSDYKVFINGTEQTVFGTFTASAMTGLDSFDFTYPTGTLPFLGNVKQAVVFNSALTDSQLAELTR